MRHRLFNYFKYETGHEDVKFPFKSLAATLSARKDGLSDNAIVSSEFYNCKLKLIYFCAVMHWKWTRERE